MKELDQKRKDFLLFLGDLFTDKSLRELAQNMIMTVIEEAKNYNVLNSDELSSRDTKLNKNGKTYINGEIKAPAIICKNFIVEKFATIIDEELENLFKNTGVKASMYYNDTSKNFSYHFIFNSQEVKVCNEKEGLLELVDPKIRKNTSPKL